MKYLRHIFEEAKIKKNYEQDINDFIKEKLIPILEENDCDISFIEDYLIDILDYIDADIKYHISINIDRVGILIDPNGNINNNNREMSKDYYDAIIRNFYRCSKINRKIVYTVYFEFLSNKIDKNLLVDMINDVKIRMKGFEIEYEPPINNYHYFFIRKVIRIKQ